MARNGSGTYNLPAGNPVSTGSTISSSWANSTLSDIASALTGSIAADGQTTPTANLLMGTYAHTNVGNASDRTMYASAGQVQDSVLTYLTSVSGTNAITASAPVVMTTYATGQTFRFIAANATTGAVTININSIGLKSIVRTDGSALVSGDIASGAAVQIMYDGTNFQLLSDANGKTETVTNLTVTGTLTGNDITTTGNTILGDASTDTLNVGNGGLVKDASGNVGIRTTTSTLNTLNINGSSATYLSPSSFPNIRGYSFHGGNAGGYTFVAQGANQSSNGSAVFTWQSSANSANTSTDGTLTTKMTLSASGYLAVGTTSATGLGQGINIGSAAGTTRGILLKRSDTNADTGFLYSDDTNLYLGSNNGFTSFNNAGSERMRLDSSGNLGLGVTPSANSLSGTGYKYLEVGVNSGYGLFNGNLESYLLANAYFNLGFKYANTSAASYYYQSAGRHQWHTAPSGTAGNNITFTQAMTLDASGNLGLGVTPVGSWGTQALMFAKTGASNPTYPFIASTESQSLNIGSNSYWDGTNWKAQFGGGGVTSMRQQINYNAISWFTAPAVTTGVTQTFTQAMTLDNSGNLKIGTVNTASQTTERLSVVAASGSAGIGIATTNTNVVGLGIYSGYTQTGTAIAVMFQDHNAVVRGTITVTTSATAYNTSSDYRLKENVAPMTGALATVSALKPCTYTWKADGAAGQGFIAHELQAVVPDCVTGEKDATETYTDDNGVEQTRPKYQGVDTSYLVATLTAAIQELKAELDTTKARLAALENK